MSELLADRTTLGRLCLSFGVATLASRQSDTHTPSLPTRVGSIRTRDTPHCLGEVHCIRPRLPA
jgi:hypothetical protein